MTDEEKLIEIDRMIRHIAKKAGDLNFAGIHMDLAYIIGLIGIAPYGEPGPG